MMKKSDTMRRFSQTRAAQNPMMKNFMGEQTEQSTADICWRYWLNVILNAIWIVVFSIFAFGSVGDPETCYIITGSNNHPNQASQFIPEVDAVNWASRFKIWFIVGVVLGIINFIIYTTDTAAKLKGNKNAHGICQLFGCFTFCLSIGHLIWIA